MTTDHSFQCDVEKLADKDEYGNQVTMVRCRGRLVSDTAGEVKDVVRPLIASGGRIVEIGRASCRERVCMLV